MSEKIKSSKPPITNHLIYKILELDKRLVDKLDVSIKRSFC